MNLEGKTVLVTGGTGSFGRALIPRLLERGVEAVRVLSRDELKQSELANEVFDPRLRLLLGDIRDVERLRVATRGVDLIVHAAALKQVPQLEYNPFEAIQTNTIGSQNVITAAIENEVSLTVGLSTDKAVAPTNLYGATKLLAERLFAQAGVYSRFRRDIDLPGADFLAVGAKYQLSRFAAVRYGNVAGSRGSVIPIFREGAEKGVVRITDERMTRFWITLSEAVEFVLSCLPLVEDGETFVPKIPSATIGDIAAAVAPDARREVVGIRPGEKLHECLLTEDEAREAYELDDRFVIMPHRPERRVPRGERLPDGFRFASDTNDRWLDVGDLERLVDAPEPHPLNR